MPSRPLLPIFLVLLQLGLAVGHAHTHPGLAGHSAAPHLHAHDLLDLFLPDHDDEDGDDRDHGHDADAVDLSAIMASAPPPAADAVSLDLAPVDAGPAHADASSPPPAPLGLPPPTAGPSRPLYLTLCTLTI